MAVTLLWAVAVSVVSLAALDGEAAAPTTCDNEFVNVSVSTPGAAIHLQCPESKTVKPTESGDLTKVFLTENGSEEGTLQSLVPGASGNVNSRDIKITFPQLPETAKTFYLTCYQDSTACGFAVTVNPSPPEGPNTCAVKGTVVNLTLKGDGGRAQFSCGEQLTTRNPPEDTKAFGSDCSSVENLKDMTLTSPGSNAYVLTATKKPSTKKLCYLCEAPGRTRGKGASGENCAVMISVSAGSGLAARSTFALGLPCVLMMLHFS